MTCVGNRKRRPTGMILVTPRRAGELESHLVLRSDAHQLTSVLQRRTDYSVPSEVKEEHYFDPLPSLLFERNRSHP